MKALFIISIMLVMLSCSVSATWWNTTYLKSYDINFTESVNQNRINEPIKLDVTNINCANADKRDLRIITNSGVEIPRQILYSGKTAVFVANITANLAGKWGSIYCNNTGVAEPSYTTGFKAVAISAQITDINIGTPDNINLTMGTAAIRNFKSDEGMSGKTIGGFGCWRGGGDLFFYNGGAGTCVLTNSGSVYANLTCSEGTAVIEMEFFLGNGLYKYTPIAATKLYSFFYIIGGGGTSLSWASILHNSYHNGVYVSTNTSTGGSVVEFGIGKHGLYAPGQPYGLMLFYNYSVMINAGDVNRSTFKRATYNDVNGCYFSDSGSDCSTNTHGNMTILGSVAAKAWAGYSNATELGTNNTYAVKMNPVISGIGVLNEICSPSWSCSAYGNCSSNNQTACLNVSDSNLCGDIFGGDLGDYNGTCSYTPPCTPSWSCSAYGNCSSNNQTACLNVSDSNLCGDIFGGDLGDYNGTCSYCWPNWYCSNYASCASNNISSCLVISDYSSCNSTAPSNYTAYNTNCTYTPPPPHISADNENLVLLAIGVFFWVAMLTLTFIFRSVALTSMMWLSGVVLGLFFAVNFYILVGFGFMLLSTFIFLWVASQHK